jgi:hypothetical protein
MDIGYGYRHWYGGIGTETRVTQCNEGRLVLDILNTKGNDLLWRGSARSRVSESSTPEKREAKINDAVAQILAKFLPQ